jgi:ribosomal protein L31
MQENSGYKTIRDLQWQVNTALTMSQKVRTEDVPRPIQGKRFILKGHARETSYLLSKASHEVGDNFTDATELKYKYPILYEEYLRILRSKEYNWPSTQRVDIREIWKLFPTVSSNDVFYLIGELTRDPESGSNKKNFAENVFFRNFMSKNLNNTNDLVQYFGLVNEYWPNNKNITDDTISSIFVSRELFNKLLKHIPSVQPEVFEGDLEDFAILYGLSMANLHGLLQKGKIRKVGDTFVIDSTAKNAINDVHKDIWKNSHPDYFDLRYVNLGRHKNINIRQHIALKLSIELGDECFVQNGKILFITSIFKQKLLDELLEWRLDDEFITSLAYGVNKKEKGAILDLMQVLYPDICVSFDKNNYQKVYYLRRAQAIPVFQQLLLSLRKR